MCTVSMIGDHYRNKWTAVPYPHGVQPLNPIPVITREEFDSLKKEVEEMKALLKRAKEYDERNNEPDCELEEKMALLRRMARMVGVDLDDVPGQALTNARSALSREQRSKGATRTTGI